MIYLLFTVLLFLGTATHEPARVEYKVITTIEFFRTGWNQSALVSQNGKIKEEVVQQYHPENYLFKKKDANQSVIRADLTEYMTLSKLCSGGTFNYNQIANNDALITSKINDLTSAGWILTFVTSGIESGEEGFVFTKYFFRREI